MDLATISVVNAREKTLIDNLHMFYTENVLCDVTLSADSVSIPCHKVILAASSPYFQAMFTGSMTEVHADAIDIQGIEAAALQNIIEYMYTAKLPIHNDNVQSVFSAAHLLRLDDLCGECSKHMQSQLDVSNCLRVYQFASLHDATGLSQSARAFILEHFRDVNFSQEFMELQHTELFDILSDDNVNVSDEVVIFETIVAWIQHDSNARKGYCQELLDTVRFELIDNDVIDGIVTSLECLNNGALLSQCVLRISQCEEHRDTEDSDSKKPLRIGMFEQEMLVFAGGSQSRHQRSLACYCPRTRNNYYAVQPYVTFDYKYRIDHHTLVVTRENDMYLIGGVFFEEYLSQATGKALAEVRCFDAFGRKWVSKASLSVPRCAHAAVMLGEHIYVIGGKSTYPRGDPLSSVERYFPTEDTWSYTTALPFGVSHHAACVISDLIYVIGGYVGDVNSMVTNSVLQFNPGTLSWTCLEQRMNIARAESGVAVLNNDIYIVGGDNGEFKINSTEIFSTRSRGWRFGPEFPEDRKSMGAVTLDGAVYICGGTRTVISRINRTPRVVEARDLWRLDMGSNSWSREAKLVQYANSHGCAVGRVNLRRLTKSEFVSSP